MRYPGGKNSAGTYQRIINLIPPHVLYVEPFLGSGAILRHKRPAAESIGIDLDPDAIDALVGKVPKGARLLMADGPDWLNQYRYTLGPTAFVYCDPPYLLAQRRSGPLYRYEMSYQGHVNLLVTLLNLRCMVKISGYPSPLYEHKLRGWECVQFEQITRGGSMATECLWMNHPAPLELHDYRYFGRDYREREKFTRQQRRWTARLARMNCLQRQALLAALQQAAEDPTARKGGPGRHRRGRR